MKIGLIGFGKMGKRINTLAEESGFEVTIFKKNEPLTASVDIFLDFSSAECTIDRLQEACLHKRPIVIGTTGWTHHLPLAQEMVKKADLTALYAPNFSLTVSFFRQLLMQACQLMPHLDRVGIETHHASKKDTPSGTALALSQQCPIAFTSVRVGEAQAKIEVIFDGPDDAIHLIYQAKSQQAYAKGALEVAQWLLKQKGWKTLDDYLHSTCHTLS